MLRKQTLYTLIILAILAILTVSFIIWPPVYQGTKSEHEVLRMNAVVPYFDTKIEIDGTDTTTEVGPEMFQQGSFDGVTDVWGRVYLLHKTPKGLFLISRGEDGILAIPTRASLGQFQTKIPLVLPRFILYSGLA